MNITINDNNDNNSCKNYNNNIIIMKIIMPVLLSYLFHSEE